MIKISVMFLMLALAVLGCRESAVERVVSNEENFSCVLSTYVGDFPLTQDAALYVTSLADLVNDSPEFIGEEEVGLAHFKFLVGDNLYEWHGQRFYKITPDGRQGVFSKELGDLFEEFAEKKFNEEKFIQFLKGNSFLVIKTTPGIKQGE